MRGSWQRFCSNACLCGHLSSLIVGHLDLGGCYMLRLVIKIRHQKTNACYNEIEVCVKNRLVVVIMIVEHIRKGYIQSPFFFNINETLTLTFYNFCTLTLKFELEMTIFVMWNCASLDETIHDLFKWATVHRVGCAHN